MLKIHVVVIWKLIHQLRKGNIKLGEGGKPESSFLSSSNWNSFKSTLHSILRKHETEKVESFGKICILVERHWFLIMWLIVFELSKRAYIAVQSISIFSLVITCPANLYVKQLKPVIGYYQMSDLNQFNPAKNGSYGKIKQLIIFCAITKWTYLCFNFHPKVNDFNPNVKNKLKRGPVAYSTCTFGHLWTDFYNSFRAALDW